MPLRSSPQHDQQVSGFQIFRVESLVTLISKPSHGQATAALLLVLPRVSAIPPIITNITTSVPQILAKLPPIAKEFNRISPDLSPIGAQFRWRRAFAPVLAILAHIPITFSRLWRSDQSGF